MTDQKKPASPDSLTESGKNAKTELTEKQLQDISGGPIYMDRLQPAQLKITETVLPTTPIAKP
jgi:bacteriocin-like protein